jgi:5'-3' exonuclease
MGIPTFFRTLLEKTRMSKETRILFSKEDRKSKTDYFFIDFNAILYTVWNEQSFSSMTGSKRHISVRLIEHVIDKLRYLIEDVVLPSKKTVIAMDGVAPLAKIIQQRQRRLKSLKTRHYLSPLSSSWDLSCHACPGTLFMRSMARAIRHYIRESSLSIQLSDSLKKGEGEHKILESIRSLSREDPECCITVFSPDNDLISLLLLTQKSDLYLLRFAVDESNEYEKVFIEEGVFYISVDRLQELVHRSYFKEETTNSWVFDYNFLLFMVGNDFIPSLPFMKIRSGGLDLLLTIYHKIKSRDGKERYLMYYEGGRWRLNLVFFQEIIYELSCREKSLMKEHHDSLVQSYTGYLPYRHSQTLDRLSEKERQKSIFEHVSIFHPLHPLREQYAFLLESIHFHSIPMDRWKQEYYRMLPPHKDDVSIRYKRVKRYIESLYFTMYYYMEGCPSWSWGYTYDVAPLFSDIYGILVSRKDDSIFEFPFMSGDSLHPREQLAMIIPHEQQTEIFSKSFVEEIRKCPRYAYHYPLHRNVSLNAWHGNKYIYSETVLSDLFEDREVRKYIRTITQEKKKEGRRSL